MNAGHDAAVVEAHARAVGVEDADDARLDLVFAVIGHRHRLGEALGLVVTAARADGVDVAPVFLGLRMDERVAVNFRGRGEQEARAFFLGQAQRLVRAERADLQRLDREVPDNQSGWRARRNARRNPPGTSRKINSVTSCWMNLKFGLPPRCEMLSTRAGDKIVNADDLVAAREQQIGQVRAEKAGGAGDDGSGLCCFHGDGSLQWLNRCDALEDH